MKLSKKLIVLSVAISSLSTFAQSTTSTVSTSTTDLDSGILSKLKPTGMSYFSQFFGPSLTSGDAVNENGVTDADDVGSVNTWNQISFQWQLDKKTRLVVNPRFQLNHNNTKKDPIEALDHVVGIQRTWYESKDKKLRFAGGLNTIVPGFRTKASRDKGMLFNPGGFNSLSYKLNSKWVVGSWIWGRAEILDRARGDNDRLARLSLMPNITYNISDKMSTTAFYTWNETTQMDGDMIVSQNDSLNLQLTYTVARVLTVQPTLTFFRNLNFDVERANIGMWMSGRFF